MFSNFNNKVICGINLGKTSKKFVKVKVSIILLNDRSNT